MRVCSSVFVRASRRLSRSSSAGGDLHSPTFLVAADLGLFLANRVALQERPTLSAGKLTRDLARNFEGERELTANDLREHTDAISLAKAQRAEMRKPPCRRTPPTAPETGQAEVPGRG